MAEMISVKEAAERWNITERRVSTLCKDGKISGAKKLGKCWMLPVGTQKPADQRVKSGAYRKAVRAPKLPLPVGVSSYSLASSEYYYVDKTRMIKEFLDERPMVTLFTRPHRFGKTMNMDMLRTFFEKSDRDTSVYFRKKKIWDCGQKYRDYQGKYPVIFLTFKDVKFNTWEESFAVIREIFAKETRRHEELRESDKFDAYSREVYENLAGGKAGEVELASALLDLSTLLHKHHGTAPIIFIDEYDIPIQQGEMHGFSDKIVSFLRNLFSGGFKDNPHLSFGFLSGVLLAAEEGVFREMNNLSVHSVLDNKYSAYFGFTADEVKEMAEYYGAADRYAEICQWYNGYRFGKTEIFNPWSVINYFSNGCDPRSFWVSTGSNDMISSVLTGTDTDTYHRLTTLVSGGSVTTLVDVGVLCPQIESKPTTLYSYLLVTGYLTVRKVMPSFNGAFLCEVALPNQEISLVYCKAILRQLEELLPQSIVVSIQEAIFFGDNTALQAQIQALLKQSVRAFHTAGERFYPGLLLGLCALMRGSFAISYWEVEDGGYDIHLAPLRKGLPVIGIAMRAKRNCSDAALKKLSEVALQQCEDAGSDSVWKAAGGEPVYKYGVAFNGEQLEVTTE